MRKRDTRAVEELDVESCWYLKDEKTQLRRKKRRQKDSWAGRRDGPRGMTLERVEKGEERG